MKITTTRSGGGRVFRSPLKLGSGKNSPPERGGFRSSSGVSGLLAICLLLATVHFSFARIAPEYGVFSGSFFRTALASGKALLTDHEKATTPAEKKTQISGKEMDEQSNLSALPPCNLISVTHTVSGCFVKGGEKYAIVRLVVTWDNSLQSSILNDTSDIIRITLGGQTRTINPGQFETGNLYGNIKSPYPVPFQVPANGSTLTAQIFTGTSFATSTCPVEITGIAIPSNCGSGGGGGSAPTAEVNCMNGQTGGIVWKDTNGDGIYQTSETSIVGGVRVEAFNKNGTPLDTTITNTAGKYVLSDVKATDYPIRIQFTQLPAGTVLGYQSDVRFVPHPDCEANFAVYEASNSSIDTTAKPFATTCFVEGDRTSTVSPSDVIVGSTTNFATPNLIASKSQTGSVWGLAYNPTKKALFSSAFLKRHVGLGPLGLGGIYVTNMTNPAAPVTTPFLDLDNFANLGTIGNFGTSGSRKYKDQNNNGKMDPGEPSWDQEAFGKVAKVGLGDIDISSDYNSLFVVNLFERKVIKVDITAYNQNGTLPTGANVSTLPNYLPLSCGTGTSRPFALKYADGKLYLGLVCDGYPASVQVQSYNFSTSSWAIELPLTNINYFRDGQSGPPWPQATYEAWHDVFDPGRVYDRNYYVAHQAILSDIEFDGKGNMILGMMDRSGHQIGSFNFSTDTTDNREYLDVFASGELLLAHKTSNGFELEASDYQNRVNNFAKTSMPREFFKDNAFHPESSIGGVAYDAGSDNIIFSAMDPITFYSGGLIKLNASTGLRIYGSNTYQNTGLTLYGGQSQDGYAGKGNGIGDVELLVAPPPPPPAFLQIGNYAWVDLDADGVQGPDEISLPGLDVSLYKKVNNNFVFVAYTKTDASGSYTFTGKGAPNEFWVNTPGRDSLLPQMEYKIVFGFNGQLSTSQVAGTNIVVGGITHALTTANIGEGGSPDMNDSDASFMSIAGGNYPSINVTTPAEGIDHSFDVGFTSSGYNGLGNFVWFDANFDGEQDPRERGVQGVKVNLHPCVDTIPGAAITSFMRTTDSYGRYIMPGVPNGNYAISFDYSMVPGKDTLRFTIPNIEFNTENLTDSDLKLPLNYLAQQPAVQVAYTGCFVWNSQGGTAFNPSFDAGLTGQSQLIDPTGYVYCESSGEILTGGLLTVTGPGNVYMIHNASQGYYQYYVDAVGLYTMTLINPPGYLSSQLCLPSPTPLDAPDSVQINNPYSIGSEDLNNDLFLDNFSCGFNRLYTQMLLEPGDFIINNNFPMACTDLGDLPSPYPTLLANQGPRHAIFQRKPIYMGQVVDAEFDGQPEAMAGMMGGGDDGVPPAIDDEDGLISPTFFVVTVPNEVRVQVRNGTTKTAKLLAFVDLNKDGDLTDAGEMKSQTVSAGYVGPVSVFFTPPSTVPVGEKTGLRLRFSTDTLMTPTSFAKDGEIEDYMITFAGFDYGDLPESYNTSGNDNPPAHIVSESLKLGASVDAEIDGNPDPMAGSMGAGDDGNVGLVTFGTSTPAGDDENGVMLASPMVPGATSSFMVNAMNMTTSPAVLQAWVDFNGNGTFETNEQLTTGSFAPNGAAVPVGGLNGAKLTFTVPSNATFFQGNAMVRFRLSPTGGLSANSQTGAIPLGEIEDYKFPLAKIGNIVFEDRDFDGTQDAGEPGIDGVNVMVTWAGANGTIGDSDDVMYQTTTGPVSGQQTGEYYVCGLINGTYKVKFTTPANMTPTRSNIGTQTNGSTVDSDGSITGMDLTMAMETFTISNVTALPTGENGLGDSAPANVGTFPDAQTDETHDQGFAFLDYGDLPESGSGDAFNTTMVEGGAVHVIIPGLKLGASVDGERDGSGSAAADGDDNSNTGSTDDEDGVVFATPLIPGYNATITVNAMNMTGSNAVLQGWIDWNNNGLLDATESLAFTNGGIVPNGGVTNAPYTFPVPSTAIFNDGMVFARFRLSPNGGQSADGPDKYNASTTVPQGEVEDYKLNVAKLGNIVFEDRDFDGTQDAGEPGINGVSIALVWSGPDNNISTTADNVTYTTVSGPASGQQTGEYYFCGLLEANYKLIYTSPANMTPTRSNIGTQTNGSTVDSDGSITGMDLTMAMETFAITNVTALPTGENGLGDAAPANVGTFPDAQTDETHDQGFAFLDYGDLPESGSGDAFNTTMIEGGAVHVIIPGLKLGASVDGERDGSGSAAADGDDNSNTGSTDDEDGVVFATPLIPGYNATITVNAMNMTGSNAVLQGWIDWNNNGLLDATESLAFTNGGIVPNGGVTNAPYTFPVPSTAIFNDGMVFARFRLSPNGGQSADGPDKYNASTTVPQGEVEDYKKNVSKVGNIVWEDYDFDGQQDATEPGIGGVTVQLVWGGPDGNTATTADNVIYQTTTLSAPANGNIVGEYNFCGLIEGTYKMVALTPSDMTPTLGNTGNQTNGGYTDSDGIVTGDITMTMTDPFTIVSPTALPTGENGLGDNAPGNLGTFPDNQTNESLDFGFVSIDFGDLPDTYVTDDTPNDSGAQHVMQPAKYLGSGIDAERNSTIDPNGTAGMWASGDDFTPSTRTQGTGADDESGIQFITPLMPGYEACVRVTYTALDVPGLVRTGNTYLSAWIDYNGNNQFDAGERALGDIALTTGTNVVRNLCFQVPASANFTGGAARARFRIHCQPGLGSAGFAIGGEVEDYYIPVVKAGNHAWFDNDLRGDQYTTDDPIDFATETGINGVDMVLVWGGLDNNLSTTSDNRVYRVPTKTGTVGENADGIYYFCGLIEGQYRVLPRKYAGVFAGAGIDSLVYTAPQLATPVRKILTIANTQGGNDYVDSDGIPSTTFSVPNLLSSPTAGVTTLNESGTGDLPTIFSYADRLTNMSLDFGFVQEPNIELNQKIAGVEKGTECGQFKVIVDLCIVNSGGAENGYVMAVPLSNIQAQVPLQQQLGAAFIMTMGAPQVINATWECGTAALPQQIPTVNPNFNGTTDVNLFNGTSGLLWPGEKVVVRYVFEVRPTNIPLPQSHNLRFQATGTGKAVNYQGQPIPNYYNGGAQFMAMDLSDRDLDFDGTYNDPDIANSIGNCWDTTDPLAANDMVYVSVDEDCEAFIDDQDILEGEDEDCTNSAFCLNGYYRVKLKTQQGLAVPNPVPFSYLGQTLVAEVENIVTCNKTWGKFRLEDKIAPKVTCADITLYCPVTSYDPGTLSSLGIASAYPTITDCDNTTRSYVDTWHDLGCGQGYNGQSDLSAYVERKWTVRDGSGNETICIQYLYFKRVHTSDLTLPSANVTVSCTSGNTAPSVTGVPTLNALGRSWNLYPNPGFCELQIVYVDQQLPVCDGTYKIVRTWTVLDGCVSAGPTNPTYYTQVIQVTDNEGPQMACPADLTVSVDPTSCCAYVEMPDVVIEDNCSRINNIGGMVTTFEQYTGAQTGMVLFGGSVTDFGNNNYWDLDTLGAFGQTSCLPVGTHTVTYTAQDDCGNTSTCTFRLTIADYVPPVAACDETTTVAIGVDDPFDCYGPGLDACQFGGVTLVEAATFNDGSYDQCNGVEFAVYRLSPYSDCIEGLNKQAGAVPCDGTNNPTEYETATGEGSTIKFYGCEVGSTQTVVLRVYQVDVNGVRMNGDDGLPIFNECQIQVEVQDKIKPVCVSPANVTVTCEQFDPSLWLYGKAAVSDNVCLDETKNYQGQCGLTHTVSYTNFDTLCNKGTIVRTFRAFDCNGQSSQCTQRIVVNYEQDYFVRFPDDKIITVCDGTGDYGEPTFYGEDCELLGVTYEDEIFTVVPDACFKIERNWKIINWCTYNPQGNCVNVPNPNPNAITNHPTNLPGPIVSPVQNAGDPWKSTVVKISPSDAQATNYSVFYDANANCYTYKQIIKIIDTQDPISQCPTTMVTICDITPNDGALWNQMYWWDLANSTHDLGDAPSDISLTATDACSGSNISFEYQLLLDLDGDGTMETVVNSTQLGSQPGGLGWNNVLYNNVNGNGISRQFDNRPVAPNQKWGFAIQEVVNGMTKTASVKFNTQQAQNTYVTPQLPYGRHKIKWFITDGCGNEAICEYTIIVKDCKAPSVVCYNGLSVNIMPTGMITMNDVDFLEYTVDNYSQTQFLRTGIRKCGTGSGFPVDANGNPITTVTFNCNELGTQCVELWSIDLAGNADYCETYVIVQDNNGNCPNSDKINVSGALKTEDTNGVEEGNVTIEGTSTFTPPFSYFDLSDNAGMYAVNNSVPVASTMTITPVKDDNPLNGVTTYDLVLISKHILGIEPLSSPYKMIAADANKSNSITTFDIVELRKLILGVYTELPNNTSWRFVDKAQTFANPANPFAAPLKENISVASALTNMTDEHFVGVKIGDVNGTAVANSAMQVDDRTNGTLLFDLNERAVKAGETFDVTFRASELTQGYQMTLNLNGLEVAGIVKSEKVSESNFGVFGDALTVSVDGEQAFTVTFRAKKSGKLSEMIGVSSRITKAEGYGVANNRLDVALRFGGNTISGVGFELYQNQPNPFVNRTVIGFHLPEASTATLTITDESGRLIYTQQGDYAKGYNAIAVDRALLNTTGILYYTVKAGDDAATLKMIQVN